MGCGPARPNITFHNGTPARRQTPSSRNAERLASSAHRRPALANQFASVTVSGPLLDHLHYERAWIAFPYGLTSQAAWWPSRAP